MRVSNDDLLRRVDARWLGMPGVTFPWRPTRYVAYAVGVPITVAVVYLASRVFGGGFWTLVYSVTVAVAITTHLMRVVDDERPANSLPALLWGELGAPRSSRHSRAHRGVWRLSVPIFITDAAAPDTLTLLLAAPKPVRQHPARFRRVTPPARLAVPAAARRPLDTPTALAPVEQPALTGSRT